MKLMFSLMLACLFMSALPISEPTRSDMDYCEWQFESIGQLEQHFAIANELYKRTGDEEFKLLANWTNYKAKCYNDSIPFMGDIYHHRRPTFEGFYQMRTEEMLFFWKVKKKDDEKRN